MALASSKLAAPLSALAAALIFLASCLSLMALDLWLVVLFGFAVGAFVGFGRPCVPFFIFRAIDASASASVLMRSFASAAAA